MQGSAQRAVGQPLPDVRLPNIHGGETSLSELRGKRRLLYLWASW
jgi:peroxiredoxin